MGALLDRLAPLDVAVESIHLERLAFPTSRWVRISTVVVMGGGGVVGKGEDVSYDVVDQDAHGRIDLPALTGRRTFAEWGAVLDAVNLFPVPPSVPEVRDYRRWAYDSALLDLALRQAGLSFAAAVGREARPVRFCVSPGGDPRELLRSHPEVELKIDAQADWTDGDMRSIAATDRVRVVDLKAHYAGEWNRHPDDPAAFTAAVAEAFPDVVLEDVSLDPSLRPFVDSHADRLSFDAIVHSVDDLRSLPRTGWCNIKPSRFGTVERLLACIDYCATEGIRLYGGGQFEIGPGRPQIQAIAGALYPDGPNDVAPAGYNAAVPAVDLPGSPLPADIRPGLG
jgi:hypothetical protein